MEALKAVEMRCGQAYVVRLSGGELIELGDVFLPNENRFGTRPYRFSDFGSVSDAEKRVMTICTMAGCCGSCAFCSVRRSFKRKLSAAEIVAQVDFLLSSGRAYGRSLDPLESKELHILYTRMGEPSLNIKNVIQSIYTLMARYPQVKIGMSTIGSKKGLAEFLRHPELAAHLMLQFSAHGTNELTREKLLGLRPGGSIMTLFDIAAFCREFRKFNSRQVSLNFVLLKGEKYSFQGLRRLFNPEDVYIRLSPLNVTGNSDRQGFEGLLTEQDVLAKAPVSSAELKTAIGDLDASGFAYAYAPAIDEEIRNQAACGQALEMLRRDQTLGREACEVRAAQQYGEF